MIILWILFPAVVMGAVCPKCPTDGIWSEWITAENCSTSCGACSSITYSRTCLSVEMDPTCTCKGDSTTKKVCNTQACNFPRANSPTKPCCDGSTPILFNNWYHCGKVEELNGTASYCCPDGGIWGEWTAWSKEDKKIEYSRTRVCVSGGFGCNCNGVAMETKFECPCPPLRLLTQAECPPDYNGTLFNRTGGHQYHATKCKATVVLEASNFLQGDFVVNRGDMVTYISFIHAVGGVCDHTRFQPYKGTANITNGQLFAWDFDCNLKTMKWEAWNPWPNKTISAVGLAQAYAWRLKD